MRGARIETSAETINAECYYWDAAIVSKAQTLAFLEGDLGAKAQESHEDLESTFGTFCGKNNSRVEVFARYLKHASVWQDVKISRTTQGKGHVEIHGDNQMAAR